jgi:hypothetical protein
MGLSNAPATFQALMNRIFAGKGLGKFVAVYLDDIYIYSRTPEEHVQHLRTVLQVLRDNQLFCRPHQCHFNKAELKYLKDLKECQTTLWQIEAAACSRRGANDYAEKMLTPEQHIRAVSSCSQHCCGRRSGRPSCIMSRSVWRGHWLPWGLEAAPCCPVPAQIALGTTE